MSETGYPHIVSDGEGKLRVQDAWFKVIMLIGDHVYHGWEAADLVEHHPPLTLGQAHSILAYYYDHKNEIDRELEERERDAGRLLQEIEARQGPQLTRSELEARLAERRKRA
jgi:uncharacterized protein (DUF433 family)